jgi:hypothetical protein
MGPDEYIGFGSAALALISLIGWFLWDLFHNATPGYKVTWRKPR